MTDTKTPISSNKLTFLSFNIKFNDPMHQHTCWKNRREFVAQQITKNTPDVVGLQEVLAEQGADLRQQLPQYDYIGNGRNDNALDGEASPILFRRSRFDLHESGQFWLSETPNVVGACGWDATYPRIATWVRLSDRLTHHTFLCINTHWDHLGVQARLESARLILNWIASHAANLPIVVLGDFNSTDTQKPYRILTGGPEPSLLDTHRVTNPHPSLNEGTFHDFTGDCNGQRIDWILCSRCWGIHATQVDRTHFNGRYPSDHFPITATLTLQPQPSLLNASES